MGPIELWQSAMITKYDLMLIEFTSDATSWTIIKRNKHCSVSRMFLREKPQSVRFMIIVTDPLKMSTLEVIKVSREVTETVPLICASKALLDMVLMKPLKPTPKKKPLIGKTNDNRAKVDKVDRTNAEIVESKDEKGDIAKGAESQIDDVAKIERDRASEAKADAVAENKTGEAPQECDSKANVEIDRGPTAAAATAALQRHRRCSRLRFSAARSATNCRTNYRRA